MHDLDYLFHPKSIATVGVSSNPGNWGGGVWPQVLQETGFAGDLYIVNPDIRQSGNIKIYSNLKDIPDSVDLAIISVPATAAPRIIEDCVSKGVKVAHVFSAGFRECGDEGARLEKEIVEIASKGGVRILGPNCMGVYHPAAGLCWRPDFPRESGNLAFLSQSGFNATNFLKQSEVRGLRFSKLISYGNACDFDETDFLEYLAADPDTRVIAAYIEGVKDGRRFFQVLREVTEAKPVVLLKGGRTEAGERATASHTGALTTKDTTWDSLFKQTRAIRVDSMEELVDTAVAFLHMSPPSNRSVALIGPGGGPNVLGADDCIRAGLSVPPLSDSIREGLSRFTPRAGTSVANPVDIIIAWTPKDWGEAIDIIGNSQEVDILIIHIGMTFQHLIPQGVASLKEISATISDAANKCGIPMAIVIYNAIELETVAREERVRFIKAGIPVFASLTSAARAIGKFIQYQDYKSGLTATNR